MISSASTRQVESSAAGTDGLAFLDVVAQQAADLVEILLQDFRRDAGLERLQRACHLEHLGLSQP